jgi:putative sterol carrier protein
MSTAKEVFNDIHHRITSQPDKSRAEIDGTFRFNLTGNDAGVWIIDCKTDNLGVRAAEETADVTMTLDGGDFVAIATGQLDGMQAFMMGQVQVEGDMGLAMKLQQVLG